MCIRLLAFIAWTVMMAQATACLAAHIDIRPVPLPMAKSRARKELVSAVEDINREIRTDAVNCDGYYRSRARVLLDTTSAFSVQLSVDEYCGGPYPETDVKAVEFDADTGDRYSPLSLYEVGTQNDVDERVKWRDDIRQSRAGWWSVPVGHRKRRAGRLWCECYRRVEPGFRSRWSPCLPTAEPCCPGLLQDRCAAVCIASTLSEWGGSGAYRLDGAAFCEARSS
jgi:hypothetical protein